MGALMSSTAERAVLGLQHLDQSPDCQGLAHEALQTDGVLGRFIASLAVGDGEIGGCK